MSTHPISPRIVKPVLIAALATIACAAEPVHVKSPNGQLEISIATVQKQSVQPDAGQLAYSVRFGNKPVLEWSNLGLAIEGAPPLGSAVRIDSSEPSSHDDTWNPVAGKANPIRDHYHAATIRAVETGSPGRRLTIEVRAYDDGVAFRYLLPGPARILNESTQFRFPKDARMIGLISRGFQTSNEDDYHELNVSALHPEYLLNLPLLIHLPGTAWVGLTDADLEDYPNLFVTADDGRTLKARLATHVDDINTHTDVAPSFDPQADASKISVIAEGPVKSGWRVLMIGEQAGRLVESNLVVNLNPPSAIAGTSWIKPGKTAWDWWNGSQAKGVSKPGMNNETMKYYIDFSARNHLEYMLIDAGWAAEAPGTFGGGYGRRVDLTKSIPAIDIPMLVAYGKSKNVGIWLWAHYRNMNDQMDDALAQFEKWGVAGVKVDFMDRTDQWMVNWYRTVARKAADHHLMVDFHGAFKPDGMRRTYPNVLTREGVMGAEYNKWSARITPKHNVTLAFTRMLAGPMDYTPGGFTNVTPAQFEPRNMAPMVMGTRAHQTALFVVFESELQMVADSPDAYTGQKETEFLQAVPASWDETRVLNGVPPEYITVARRRGNEWFVGSITDDPRQLEVPLSFLGSGSYDAQIYSDGPNAAAQPTDSTVEKRRVSAQTVLTLKLAPGGGAAIRLTPVR